MATAGEHGAFAQLSDNEASVNDFGIQNQAQRSKSPSERYGSRTPYPTNLDAPQRDDENTVMVEKDFAGFIRFLTIAALYLLCITSTARAVDVTEQEMMANVFLPHCAPCHGKWKQEGGLDVRTRDSLLRGGDSGPALVSGDAQKSLVFQRILADEMPPKKDIFGDTNYVRRVKPSDLERLRTWINSGTPPIHPEEILTVDAANDPLVSDEDRNFWSFLPPAQPPIPSAGTADTPIDSFLLRALQDKGLQFAAEASPQVLVRRAHFVLVGLPPEPETVEQFQDDPSSAAFEKIIDRLLASPRYGERWATYWLDSAGFAETHGKADRDELRRFAWRYRDYVIRALSEDKPYDRFLLEQIAGDELFDHKVTDPLSPEQRDALIATGFLRTAADGTDELAFNFIPERLSVLHEQISIFSSTVMGLTLECARCHDHKYDPIPQRDYYRFSAIFRSALDPFDWRIPGQVIYPPANPIPDLYQRLLPDKTAGDLYVVKRYNQPFEAQADELRRQLAAKENQPDSENELKALRDRLKTVEKKMLRPVKVQALFDVGGEPSPTYILRRGAERRPAERVDAGVPSALHVGLQPYTIVKPAFQTDTTGHRLALARWLIQPRHPLTARVIVNRVWQHHFGVGLVRTPANFGLTGEAPTHPELLDWLATQLVEEGWSLKWLHRVIMTSRAYRQSSLVDEVRAERDPNNTLLSRFPLRRLDAEALRDSVLSVAARLDRTPFGPSADLDISTEGEVAARDSGDELRRSVYLLRRRSTPITLLDLFGTPRMLPNCVQRVESTVPSQALQLMNSRLVRASSEHFARRVLKLAGDQPEEQVRHVYRLALSRQSTSEEQTQGVEALTKLTQAWKAAATHESIGSDASEQALATFCLTIFNSPQFIYVD